MKLFSPRGGKDEEYYAEYISEAVGEKTPKLFKPFEAIFQDSNFHAQLKSFSHLLNDLSLETKYTSIIETDITFFGLIYYGLIADKKINFAKKDVLHNKIQDKLSDYKDFSVEDNRKQEKNPNTLKYIRRRLFDSIEIYKEFVVGD